MRPLFIAVAFTAILTMSAPNAHAQTDAGVTEAAAVRDSFWHAIDDQDHASAYTMLTDGMRDLESLEQFSSINDQTTRDMGRALERRVMRTTVYDNPAGAPQPGVYVAFDFVGRFERADRNCGYIILHQPAEGGPFRVTRSDQSFLPNNAASGSGQSLDEIWVQMATRLCPGWQPSWSIQPPV